MKRTNVLVGLRGKNGEAVDWLSIFWFPHLPETRKKEGVFIRQVHEVWLLSISQSPPFIPTISGYQAMAVLERLREYLGGSYGLTPGVDGGERHFQVS